MQLERLSDPTYPMYMRTLTLIKPVFCRMSSASAFRRMRSCVTATIISN